MIAARAHNRLAAMVRRKSPRYLRMESRPLVHPWFTRVSWNEEAKGWEARVRPGLVNGRDPAVPGVEVEEGKDEVGSMKDEGGKPLMRVARLCDGVAVPLHGFRDGFAGISKGARLFFEQRGAKEPPKDRVMGDGVGGVKMEAAEDEEGANRRLVAMELYLATARPTLKGAVQVVDATGITGQVAQYATGLDDAVLQMHGAETRLMQAPTYPGNATKPTAMDILMGNFTDDGEDRIPVCTVFLMSPPDWDAEAEPDGAWSPYVQHHLFWNVVYCSKFEPPVKPLQPIRLATGLAWADWIGNQMMAPLNDLMAQAFAAVTARNPEGAYFTV